MATLQSQSGEQNVSPGGDSTITIANAAIVAGGQVTARKGRLCRILVITLIGANAVTFTDGNGGTVIAIVAANSAVGTQLQVDMPVATGIFTVAAAGGGAVTISVF
jgi:hypothetical protein